MSSAKVTLCRRIAVRDFTKTDSILIGRVGTRWRVWLRSGDSRPGNGAEPRRHPPRLSRDLRRLAQALVDRGFEPEGRLTHRVLAVTRLGKGAGLLLQLGRVEDLGFTLDRVDDIDLASTVVGGEIVPPAEESRCET